MPTRGEARGSDPHAGRPVALAGVPLDAADLAVILLHGRGASASGILSLAPAIGAHGAAYLAPEAAGHTWYPHSFLAPLSANEPWLGSALALVRSVLDEVARAGIPHDRVFLLGFSQGGCLALEFAARNPRRYGGIVALSGALIGTSELVDAEAPANKRFDYPGTLEGTPAFLGCGDPDAHIPRARVHRSTEVLRGMGADVTERIYPGAPHGVNEDEIAFVRGMLAAG